jgi:hypothetical protein
MVRQAHHDRLDLPLVLRVSKDALRLKRLSPDLVQEVKVFEAKKRFGLCVLNYAVTSNHIHLLVKDTGQSMQIIAGRRSSNLDALLLKETRCLRKKLFR